MKKKKISSPLWNYKKWTRKKLQPPPPHIYWWPPSWYHALKMAANQRKWRVPCFGQSGITHKIMVEIASNLGRRGTLRPPSIFSYFDLGVTLFDLSLRGYFEIPGRLGCYTDVPHLLTSLSSNQLSQKQIHKNWWPQPRIKRGPFWGGRCTYRPFLAFMNTCSSGMANSLKKTWEAKWKKKNHPRLPGMHILFSAQKSISIFLYCTGVLKIGPLLASGYRDLL